MCRRFWGTLHYGFVVAILLAVLLAGVLDFHPLGLRGAHQRRKSGRGALCRHPGPPPDRSGDAHLRRHCRVSPACWRWPARCIGCRAASPTISAMSASWSRCWRVAPASACIAAAVLMAVILNAGIVLQTKGITVNTVLAMTGLILFFTAIGDELAHYRLARPSGEAGLRIARHGYPRRHPFSRGPRWRRAGARRRWARCCAERVGVVNLGVEGLMALGAVVAIIVVMTVPNVYLGLLRRSPTGFCVERGVCRRDGYRQGKPDALRACADADRHRPRGDDRQALFEHARAGELRAAHHSLSERPADHRPRAFLAEPPRLRDLLHPADRRCTT